MHFAGPVLGPELLKSGSVSPYVATFGDSGFFGPSVRSKRLTTTHDMMSVNSNDRLNLRITTYKHYEWMSLRLQLTTGSESEGGDATPLFEAC